MHRFLLACALGLIGCATSGGEKEASEIEGPRGEQLAGTGSVDVVVVDGRSEFETAHKIAWWEIELRLLDDDVDSTGVISTTDTMRVAVDFWAHAADGAVQINGRFALDLTRWLSLSVERDPDDIAAIFEGTFVNGGDKTAVLTALMNALAADPAAVASAASALVDGEALGTCVGSGKAALKKALASIKDTFGKCVACASDGSWDACGKCESGITDAKSALGLFDILACKKALVLPGKGGDSDDAGGPLVKVPETVATTTCYEASADKIHGTMRVTDGKGSVSCADCPSDMEPADNKLGCATPVSVAAETSSIVLVAEGKGKAGKPRVVSSDVCVVVDVTGNGTINGGPIEKGPSRSIIKLGARTWGALPKNVLTSKDQWDLTTDKHSSATKGKYAISGSTTPASKKPTTWKGTVDQAIARGGCASRPVYGLSQQILEELGRCVRPGFLVKVPSGGQLNISADHAYLEKPAAEALVKAMSKRPGKTISISSMYRTIAQQYFLYRRASCFDAVASPGRSNHETGIAIDVSDPDNSTWRSALQSVGFAWLGSKDRFHFDYRGAGAQDLRGDDVKAFQRLWNRNNPGDKIGEDGAWGPDTESRMKKSPADGFPLGADESCEPMPTAPSGKGSREPFEYFTNVTAEMLPGEGCETGSDASHTDVNGCVSVKQVCEPFWCDLADQRSSECQ
jgi:hypothetical protein